MKKKIVLIIASIFVVVATIAGVTYAYYSANVNRINESQTVVKTNKLTLIYTGGQEINVSGIVPGDSFTKTFTIENTSNTGVDYNIYLENIINEFNEDLVYTLSDETGNVIEESVLPVSNNGKTYIKSKIRINSKKKDSYTLKVLFKNSLKDQNNLQGKIFNATLGVDTNQIEDVQITNNKISINNLDDSVIQQFNVINSTNKIQTYDLKLDNVVNNSSNDINYTLKKDGVEVVNNTVVPSESKALLENISIEGSSSDNYEMEISSTTPLSSEEEIFSADLDIEYIKLSDISLKSAESTTNSITAEFINESPNEYKSQVCYIGKDINAMTKQNSTTDKCEYKNLEENTKYYFKKCIIKNNNQEECSTVSSLLTAGQIVNYDYSGKEETYTLPCNAEIKLETWGAQGGEFKASRNGYGGYSVGYSDLVENTNLFINVGGKGISGTSAGVLNTPKELKGGYNGGGNAVGFQDNYSTQGIASGGGATHIATVSGLLSTLESYKNTGGNNISNEILVVAGGAGGIACWASDAPTCSYSGGNCAGGGYETDTISNTTTWSAGSWNTINGATQTSGAYFGTAGKNNCAGGGGGFYGGNTGLAATGGTGYINSSKLKSLNNNLKHMACYGCKTSSEEETRTISTTSVSETPVADNAKKGNGYAKVSILSCKL